MTIGCKIISPSTQRVRHLLFVSSLVLLALLNSAAAQQMSGAHRYTRLRNADMISMRLSALRFPLSRGRNFPWRSVEQKLGCERAASPLRPAPDAVRRWETGRRTGSFGA